MLAHSGYGTRKEVKQLIRDGYVLVNGEVIVDDDFKVDEINDEIFVDGFQIDYRKHLYVMLNKPKDVVSATYDSRQKTILDLMPEYDYLKLFPIGRLDIDTEGLVLLSNDGDLAHKLLSPKKHVDKEYYVEVKNPLKTSDVIAFTSGITLDDGYKCLSARLEIIDELKAHVIIKEGKFHQIKRMFEALNNEVTYLKRIRMKNLILDPKLDLGEYRELTDEEINDLKGGEL
jgi:16S rRNA pseudouridine516 synthase